ncbi:MAG: hypothetical protein GF408_01575 [Candidatus Omnitrophica bacterium]|nr:hypothetical protein [Candidatus Omnitrophota bacterium]
MECKKTKNMDICNCTYSCAKKGVCCDCLHYHRNMGQMPACFFPEDIESGYDRSISNFVKVWQERKHL